jgi:prepilin-type N-terminal cleavage/methylation domain-containing protein
VKGELMQKSGFSLLEVVVSLVILLIGILGILAYFPRALRANDRAVVLSDAAMLAHRQAELIRQDPQAHILIAKIKSLAAPTEPVVFPGNPNLAYRFCGLSLLDPTDDPNDPRDDHGVARVIVEYAKGREPAGRILYELRFDE